MTPGSFKHSHDYEFLPDQWHNPQSLSTDYSAGIQADAVGIQTGCWSKMTLGSFKHSHDYEFLPDQWYNPHTGWHSSSKDGTAGIQVDAIGIQTGCWSKMTLGSFKHSHDYEFLPDQWYNPHTGWHSLSVDGTAGIQAGTCKF